MTDIPLGLSARDTRTLITGGAVVAALFGLARGLPAALAWQRDRVSVATALRRETLALRASARALPARRDSLQVGNARLSGFHSVMLSAPSAAAAAAELVSLLDDVADAAGLKVNAMQLRADSAGAGSLARVAVRVSGTADVAGLAAFLRAIEAGRAPLLVRELVVTQPDPLSAADAVEALGIDVLVETLAFIAGPTTMGPGRRP